MKVLIVASLNSGKFSPFVVEQAESLRNLNIEIEYLGIVGKGIYGYLNNKKRLIKAIKIFNPDIIHAHYGLSGLFANLQRKIPVVTTYHGSDIHSGGYLLLLSRLCMILSVHNVFVSKSLFDIACYTKKRYTIISCGVNTNLFHIIPEKEARIQLKWAHDDKYILFAGSFDNKVKNCKLAKKAVDMVTGCHLIELKSYTREEVNIRMNGCNVLLVTSLRESGPLVVKEAMACNVPIVTVNVGDVNEVIGDTAGCYICKENDSLEIASNIKKALLYKGGTKGRKRIIQLGLSLEEVAKKIRQVYETILNL